MTIQIPPPPSRLSRAESREHTRSRLIRSAIELFAQAGVNATSLNTVAEQAGFSRGAFHSNFSDKAELSRAVAAEVIAMASPKLGAVLRSPVPTTLRLSDYIREYMGFCAQHPSEARALVAVVTYLGRLDAGHYETQARESLADLIALFQEGQQQGEMRAFDAGFMAATLRSTLDTTFARLSGEIERPAFADATAELVTIFDLATRRETR